MRTHFVDIVNRRWADPGVLNTREPTCSSPGNRDHVAEASLGRVKSTSRTVRIESKGYPTPRVRVLRDHCIDETLVLLDQLPGTRCTLGAKRIGEERTTQIGGTQRETTRRAGQFLVATQHVVSRPDNRSWVRTFGNGSAHPKSFNIIAACTSILSRIASRTSIGND